MVGVLIMIVPLFVGNFYAGDPGGGYMYSISYPGYKLILNSEYLLGTLFIVISVAILVVGRIQSLKQYEGLLSLDYFERTAYQHGQIGGAAVFFKFDI